MQRFGAERMKNQIEDKAGDRWRTLIPICSFQHLDHMWRPPQVPPWLGGCQLGFCAALDGDNEKLQTSLPLITGSLLGMLSLSSPGCHDQTVSSLTAGHR